MTSMTHRGTRLLLPGQAAALEGPVDMTMMYLMHHAFRRDLAAFAAAVPATPVEAIATWRAMLDRWTGFARTLHHHHSGEDAGLWPLLLERVDLAGDTAGRATLEAMEAEHEQIDPLLASCEHGLRELAVGGTVDDRSALAVRMVATREALGRHLVHEETEAIALVQRYLSQQDWTEMENTHFKSRAPRLSELMFVVPWVLQELPLEAQQRVYGEAGQGMRLVWFLSRGRFDRLERKAFAYR